MLIALHHPSPAAIADAMLRHQAALELGQRLNPARATTPAAEALSELPNVVSLADFAEDTPACVYQREFQGREPFLLRPDAADPFSFVPVAIQTGHARHAPEGRYWVELGSGFALVPADTLVYWR